MTGCGSTHSDRLPGWRGGQLTLNSQRLFVQAEKFHVHCNILISQHFTSFLLKGVHKPFVQWDNQMTSQSLSALQFLPDINVCQSRQKCLPVQTKMSASPDSLICAVFYCFLFVYSGCEESRQSHHSFLL